MPAYGTSAYGGAEYAGPPVAGSPYVETNQGRFPLRFVEIAPGYGPNDTAPVWVNIAFDVTQIQTKRGRQHQLGRFEAGTMTVTIDNKSGRYSPFNASSPYYGQLKPGMPIRFRSTWGPVTFSQFTGYVESWPMTWPAASDSVVTVTAVDGTKFLNLKKATAINTYATTVAADTPYLWYRCDDPVGSPVLTDSGSARKNLPLHFSSGWPYLSSAPQAIYANPTFQSAGALVADTSPSVDLGGGGTAFGGALDGTLPSNIAADAAMSIETWYQSGQGAGSSILGGISDSAGSTPFALATSNDGNAAIYATGSGGTGAVYSSLAPVNDGHWHHIVATNAGSSMVLYVDGIVVLSTTKSADGFTHSQVAVGGRPYGPDPNGVLASTIGSLDEFAVYTSTLSATQVGNHYVAGAFPRYGDTTGARIAYLAGYTSIPASMRVIDTGQSTVQGATDQWLKQTILKNMQDQADTERGDLFIDAAGNLTFFDRQHTSRSPYGNVSLILGDSGAAPEEPYRLNGLTVPYDDVDLVNEVAVTPAGMAPQFAVDTTSQQTLGARTMALGVLSSSVNDAIGRAQYELNINKTSQPRVESITINPADDPTMLFGPVLGFDLLTRVELRRRPMDGSGSIFDQTCLVEGIEHRVTKAAWETTWRLSVIDATKVGVFNETNFGEVNFAF